MGLAIIVFRNARAPDSPPRRALAAAVSHSSMRPRGSPSRISVVVMALSMA
jgi:hypothetical protein